MNASFATVLAVILLGGTSCVLAASSVDLTVKGLITPSACSPSLSEDGTVDFGKLPARDLSLESTTQLPLAPLKLSVSCEAPTLFALHTGDNRLGSSYFFHPRYYGLGLINGDQKLGSYEIGVFNPIADVPVSPLISFDSGKTWLVNSSGSYMEPGAWIAFGDSPTPKALSSVTVDLRIDASIAPAKGLTLTSEVPLNGSATLDVVYL